MDMEADTSSPEVMMAFYKRLYPFKSIFNWLNHQHAPSRQFTHREFAFTLLGDVYIRYNSFSTADELKRQVIRLNPSRFEIGAIYNARPRDKKTLRAGALQPIQRELVFDIDMTDYDEIRTCCSGKGICKRCWGFISVAVKVLDTSLREQFGFQHLLWVYSGRRGIHCWVSDAEAMQLTDEQRKSIMGWIDVIKGGQDMVKKVNVRAHNRPLPPSLQAAVRVARTEFSRLVLADQDCFANEAQSEVLLELLGDKEVASRLRKKWSDVPKSSEDKWVDIRRELTSKTKQGEEMNSPLFRALEDVMLQYTYPRIDSEVTKHRNHLLKAPFCVHPATGRVCVPVDPRRVDDFDPESVPTVGQLLRELDELGSNAMMTEESEAPTDGTSPHQHGKPNSVQLGIDEARFTDPEAPSATTDWEKTSLKPYIDMLDQHTRGLMEEVRRLKREQGNDSHDF